MKIRPEVEVFDDAEYCRAKEATCGYLRDKCTLFKTNLLSDEHGYQIKCDQCKADYLKAKREEQGFDEFWEEWTAQGDKPVGSHYHIAKEAWEARGILLNQKNGG